MSQNFNLVIHDSLCPWGINLTWHIGPFLFASNHLAGQGLVFILPPHKEQGGKNKSLQSLLLKENCSKDWHLRVTKSSYQPLDALYMPTGWDGRRKKKSSAIGNIRSLQWLKMCSLAPRAARTKHHSVLSALVQGFLQLVLDTSSEHSLFSFVSKKHFAVCLKF